MEGFWRGEGDGEREKQDCLLDGKVIVSREYWSPAELGTCRTNTHLQVQFLFIKLGEKKVPNPPSPTDIR